MDVKFSDDYFNLNVSLEGDFDKSGSEQLISVLNQLSKLIKKKLKKKFNKNTFYPNVRINLTCGDKSIPENQFVEKVVSDSSTYPAIENLINTIAKFQRKHSPLWQDDENGFLLELAGQLALKDKRYIQTFVNIIETIDGAHECSFYDLSAELLGKYEFDTEVAKLFVSRNLESWGQCGLDETNPEYFTKLKALRESNRDQFDEFIKASFDFIVDNPNHFGSRLDVDNILEVMENGDDRAHQINALFRRAKKNDISFETGLAFGHEINFSCKKVKSTEDIVRSFDPEAIVKKIKHYLASFPSSDLYLKLRIRFKKKDSADFRYVVKEYELFDALVNSGVEREELIEFARELIVIMQSTEYKLYNGLNVRRKEENCRLNHFFAWSLFDFLAKTEEPDLQDLYHQYINIIQKKESSIEVPYLLEYLKKTEVNKQSSEMIAVAITKTPAPVDSDFERFYDLSNYGRIEKIVRENSYNDYYEEHLDTYQELFKRSLALTLEGVQGQETIDLNIFRLILLVTPASVIKDSYATIIREVKQLATHIIPIRADHTQYIDDFEDEDGSKKWKIKQLNYEFLLGSKEVEGNTVIRFFSGKYRSTKEILEYLDKEFGADHIKKLLVKQVKGLVASKNNAYVHNSEYINEIGDCFLTQENPVEHSVQLMLLLLKMLYEKSPQAFVEFEGYYAELLLKESDQSIALHKLFLCDEVNARYRKLKKEQILAVSRGRVPPVLLEKFNKECLITWKDLPFYTCFDPLTKLADSGNVDAQYLVGRMYQELNCLNPKMETSEKYFKLASDQGHKLALLELAKIYRSRSLRDRSDSSAELQCINILKQLTTNQYPVKNLPQAWIELSNRYITMQHINRADNPEITRYYEEKEWECLQEAVKFKTPEAYYLFALLQREYADERQAVYYFDLCSKIPLKEPLPFDETNQYILKSKYELMLSLEGTIKENPELKQKYEPEIQKLSEQLKENNFSGS